MADEELRVPAQVAARLTALVRELDAERSAHADLRARYAAMQKALAAAEGRGASADASAARVEELEKLFGTPSDGSSIVAATGYFTADFKLGQSGHHVTLPAAQHRAAVVGLMTTLGVTEVQAEALVSRRDAILAHLSVLAD